jgi:recombination protein RecA
MGAKKIDTSVEALDLALASIEKQFGKGSIMRLGEEESHESMECIGTGILGVDLALGNPIPKGRIIEIYGPESSGKTTLTLHIAAECQAQGGTVAFVDAEHALDTGYASDLGVDIPSTLISQPSTGEEALEITNTLVASNAVDLVIVDSVAALTPKAELEGDMGASHMGLQARLMSQALRKLTGSIAQSNCTVIFINQLRMKIGVMFGNPETTTGGNALKYYASQRIDIRGTQQIKLNDEVVGKTVKVKVVKNKVSAPFKVVELDIAFGEGFSKEGDLIEQAVKHGVIEKNGAWYAYGENKIGQGKENTKGFLRGNPEVYNEIFEKVLTVVDTGELPC